MTEQEMKKLWAILNGTLVLLKEVATDVPRGSPRNRRLLMAIRDLGIAKELVGRAVDEASQGENVSGAV